MNVAAYKAVVALNNAGVGLLQRRRFTEGAETLKDALRLMRTFFHASECSDGQEVDVNEALQAAYRRTSAIREEYEERSDINICIAAITDNEHPYEVFHRLERSTGVIFCIQIDPVDSFCGDDMERLEIESAVILYNYGIAHLCACPTPSTPESRSEYTQRAYQLISLAESIVKVHLQDDCDQVDTPTNALLVSMLINTSLYQLSSHNLEMTFQNKRKLEYVLSTILNLEMMFPLMDPNAAASA
jgi:hypothetical protein